MRKLNLKTKLLLLCAFFIGVIFVVGLTAYKSSHDTSEVYGDLVAVTLPKEALLIKSYQHFLEIRMNLRNLGLPGISDSDSAEAEKKVQQGLKDIAEARKAYEALGFTPGQKVLYDKQIKIWQEFEAVGGRVLGLYKANTPEAMKEMIHIFFTECPQEADAFTAAN